jgi:GTP-binding protein EngB required for normal cell division
MQTDDTKSPLFENLRKLINVVDELRDVGLQQYINLPRIAVLGTQSAGKSSLLESIMGIDCLPRGDGVVTRRPLELRLIHTPHIDKPWGQFEEIKGEKFLDFDKVKDKINELTDKICGSSKGIVDQPIVLTVYSPTCPDLTLIDLPGITRVPLPGQDPEIERITKEMAGRYCKDPRTIILCVISANADMSTSDGLQMARIWDPSGERTIGVITKIDIMDRGTNAKKMLLGQEIPLKLGYVGVKGRSQADIQEKMKVTKALEMEKEYFASHAVYSTLPPGHCGTEALTQKLTKILFHHIRLHLPTILKEIVAKCAECEERLRDLGTPLPVTSKEKMQLLWNMIMDFTENFKNTLKGKYDGRRLAKLTDDISGGAKIKQMFHCLYSDLYKKNPSEGYSDKDIELAIKYHQGDSIPGFPSMDAFLYLINPVLDKLKEPANTLINEIHSYLETLASILIEKIFMRFPGIVDDITEITGNLLRLERDQTKELVEQIIESEQNYIFTNDLGYLVQNANFIPVVEGGKDPQTKQQIDPTKVFVGELRSRLDAYINIVLRNIKDLIPKVIGNFLVNAVQSKLQYTIYNEINRKEELMNALGEPPHITAERETLSKVLAVLNKAKKVLQKDPDLATPLKTEESKERDDYPAPAPPQAEAKAKSTTNGAQSSYTSPATKEKEVIPEPPKPTTTAPTGTINTGLSYNTGNGVVIDDIKVNPLNGTVNANLKPDSRMPFANNISVPVQADRGMVAQASSNNPLTGGGAKPISAQPTTAGPLGASSATGKPGNTSLFGDLLGGGKPNKKG